MNQVKGNIIKWARERANLTLEEAAKKIPINNPQKFEDWEKEKEIPTLKQLQTIAKKFYVPFGYLFLSEPPQEDLPITDFRTMHNDEIEQPSIELLETIYDAQRKQTWLREQKIEDEEEKIIINSANISDSEIIKKINNLLKIEELREQSKTYDDFSKNLIERLDTKGFMVIRTGIVGDNTSRPLNNEEFKGFALFDEYAPLVFINGKDYKSSQIFTLVHELVHLFLGENALDGGFDLQVERKCNKLAAEILLPKEYFKQYFNNEGLEQTAKYFKVSAFVVLIKAKQEKLLKEQDFQQQWENNLNKIKNKQKSKSGGNYYRNVKFRAGGENFLLRVLHSTLSGQTTYRDAYNLTGLKAKSFDECFKKMGLR